jgi:hypothetical protein
VRATEAGLASALLNTGQQIGGALGLAVLVTVATRVKAGHLAAANQVTLRLHHALVTNEAVTSGYDAAFRIGSVIALCAFILAVTVLRGRRQGAADIAAVEAGEPEVAVA